MEFSDLVQERRSVRTFSDRVVSESTIKTVLEYARLAPSWKNSQCWHFVVVTDRTTIDELVANGAVFGNAWIRNAPVLVIACGDPSKSGDMNGISYSTVDVSIAMEHLVLGATDLGLGACWVGIFDKDKIKERFGIPKHIEIVALTPLGYPAVKANVRDKATRLLAGSNRRKPIEEILHKESW